jgi:nucleoside-diphosphate-sugar epimerase
MRVLIAGATGAIGRPLMRCLIEHGHAIFALARSPQSAREVAESVQSQSPLMRSMLPL